MRYLATADFPRRCSLPLLLLLSSTAASDSSTHAAEPDSALEWHPIAANDVQGKGWDITELPFDRLPAKAKSIVRPEVWNLAHHSAGLYVDFLSDSAPIWVRWTVTSERLAMPHMPASSVSGIDLYINRHGTWHFVANGRPVNSPTNCVQLHTGQGGEQAKYRLYFPLYNGVSTLEIGLSPGSLFDVVQAASDHVRPVVIYGTSITQGGCASRPGMSYAAILGRRMDVPVVNLGFSGNGKAEPELAQLLSELEASAFVLDVLPNLFAPQVSERLPTFIEIIRSRQPDVPILLMESPLYPNIPFSESQARRVSESNANLRKIYEARRAAGDSRLSIIPGSDFTTNGGEATVDGVHPTDVGFLQQADVVETSLHLALGTVRKKAP